MNWFFFYSGLVYFTKGLYRGFDNGDATENVTEKLTASFQAFLAVTPTLSIFKKLRN